MSDNSVISREIDNKRILDEIALEVGELKEIISQKTTKDRLESERLKKKLNRSLWVLGSSVIVAIVLSGMVINSGLSDLKDRQQQLIQQISSLNDNQLSSQQIEGLENKINNLSEQIESLNQQVTPYNYPSESNELNSQHQEDTILEENEKLFQNR